VTEAERPLPASPTQLRIGLWGPPGSGKTTFLAALKIATTLGADLTSNWIMNGVDDDSSKFLQESMYQLTKAKSFPTGTQDSQFMMFRFTGEQQVERRMRFGRRVVEKQRVAFEMEVLDVPGRVFGHKARSAWHPADLGSDDDELSMGADSPVGPSTLGDPDADIDDELLDHLQSCDGIVYLFDPERESREGDAFDYFHLILEKLAARILGQDTFTGTRLPQHIAVCVTKFDQPDIFHKAQIRGYVTRDQRPPYLPRVPDNLAAPFFQMLCADPLTNADLLERGMRQYFNKIGYFVTSSVGFYVANGHFKQYDGLNVGKTETGEFKIRGKAHPINVLEPVLWLHQSLSSAAPR
jgi:hypothetical protein